MINLPNDLATQKRFRRIIEMIVNAVDDETADLAEALLAEADAPAPPEDPEAYDRWIEIYLEPAQNRIWELIAESLA